MFERVLSCVRNFKEGEKNNTGTPNKFRTRDKGLRSATFCLFNALMECLPKSKMVIENESTI